ncbi:(2Fe-2S)-binding protein [Actinomadura litoris]|uniref:(2Fe-2S)-binding protein n=1 Tax=Actinomadura litoris TaxID=2678616 RepID=UPI001FA75333|nr:(2Fe-2S)-binding protein [Actinomadura litoris]
MARTGGTPTGMYVCICNAVTEDDVYGCMAGGACTSAKDVKAACGMKPGCGSCTKRIHAMVSEFRTASDLADALTGGPHPLTAVPETTVPETTVPGTTVPGPIAAEAIAAEPERDKRGAAPPTAA